MNVPKTSQKYIVALLVISAIVACVTSWYVHEVQADTIALTKLKISEQETTLATLAEMTDRDGADEVVERIIKDCNPENRERFDRQLGNLPQLKGQELVDMEQLFNDCGNFFAVRKAVMSARLQREYEVYANLVEVLSLLDKKTATVDYEVQEWEKLVSLEQHRSDLSMKLVDIQGSIISSLRKNISIASDDMQATLVEGQKAKEELVSLSAEIDLLRQEILDI